MNKLSWVVIGATVLSAAAHLAAAGNDVSARIAAFVPQGFDAARAGPSLALEDPSRTFSATGVSVSPAFSRSADGRWTAAIEVSPGTSLYGTGEIAGPLLRNGWVSETWNTDAYAYTTANKSLYQSHPWVLAVRPDGTAFGALADTTWRCEINLGTGIQFRAAGPEGGFRVIVIEGATPQDVVSGLADLTGRMPLPPKWAIGYHQCRYSYNPESRVREIAAEFRNRDIPCDVIWFDIDYMDGYRVFTFDSSQFPDPARLNTDLENDGFRCIWMIDPGIKAEPGYWVFDQGLAGGHFVTSADGSLYRGEVWPGKCAFPDYTRPETRAWWSGLYKDFMATGIDGVWNDMNEPAVFNVASKTMPEDNIHRGGQSDSDGLSLLPGTHAQYHNVYGMLMARATMEGILAVNPDKRPFVLTRANYIGGQRFGAMWTGDNSAQWDDLEASVPMVLNMGLSGQPFAGPDIGGFNDNGDGAMFARWMGIGALLPFSRGHTGKGNINKEPFAFDSQVETTCRHALQRRYRLLPYLYSAFREAATTGIPVARPLFFADPRDPALRSEDDAFLLGGDVLVAGRLTPQRDRAIAMPRGDWKLFTLVGEGDNPDLPTLFLRDGSALPVGPIMEFTGERTLDTLTLMVNPDDKGRATCTIYEDAGEGWGYLKGEYRLTRFDVSVGAGQPVVEETAIEGSWSPPARAIVVDVLK